MQFCYILSINKEFYIGQTKDIIQRVNVHKNSYYIYITNKNESCSLVYYEVVDDDIDIIQREYELKKLSSDEILSLINNIPKEKQLIINMINNSETPKNHIYKQMGYTKSFFKKLVQFDMNLYEEIEDICNKYGLGNTNNTIIFLIVLGKEYLKKL